MKTISEIQSLDISAQHMIGRLKREFEQVISNPDLTLEVRWRLFAGASDYLKNHKKYVETLDALSQHVWSDVFGVDKYETIDLAEDIVQWIEDDPDYYARAFLPGKTLDDLKEEILRRNLGKMTYEW